MTLTTIDLFRIHTDEVLLAQLHALQAERLVERSVTSGDRPTGLRLSIADPVRRVKAALDPFWSLSIDEGVGERGHILEDYLEVALFHATDGALSGCPYKSQVPIQWHSDGRSAFDWVAYLDGADRPISCKSSIRSEKPSAANSAQERRMMALAGYAPGSEFDIYVIDPSTFRATGPYTYTLDADDIDQARAELAGVSAAFTHFCAYDDPREADEWNSPEAWQERWGLTSTSGAFALPTLDASPDVAARTAAFLRARARLTEAKQAEEAAKEAIRVHVQEQLAAAELHGREVKGIEADLGVERATFSIDKRGAMRVTVKPAEGAAA